MVWFTVLEHDCPSVVDIHREKRAVIVLSLYYYLPATAYPTHFNGVCPNYREPQPQCGLYNRNVVIWAPVRMKFALSNLYSQASLFLGRTGQAGRVFSFVVLLHQQWSTFYF